MWGRSTVVSSPRIGGIGRPAVGSIRHCQSRWTGRLEYVVRWRRLRAGSSAGGLGFSPAPLARVVTWIQPVTGRVPASRRRTAPRRRQPPDASECLTRVLIVDDHLAFSGAVEIAINAQADMISVGEAASVVAALDAVRRQAPDVVLMDVHLPDGDGIAATKQIVELGLGTRVLILTAHTDGRRHGPRRLCRGVRLPAQGELGRVGAPGHPGRRRGPDGGRRVDAGRDPRAPRHGPRRLRPARPRGLRR